MTTYSGVIGKNDATTIKIDKYLVYRLNFGLLVLVILLAAAYVFLANLYVSQKYSLGLRKNELSVLNGQAVSQSQNSAGPGLGTLFLFAQKSGMIEAKDSDSILQERDFAVEVKLR